MVTEERKKELDNLRELASCADDDYYYNMNLENFLKSLPSHCEDEAFYKGYKRQREIGFLKYKREIAVQLAELDAPEELHYLAAEYNYDDGPWVIEQIIMNPACDAKTAKMAYWQCQPDYFYERYGGPENCPADDTAFKWAQLLVKIEEKARCGGFRKGMRTEGRIFYDEPAGIDFGEEPFFHVPEVLR